ncbi:MAG TPA: gliding motility protein GldN [Mucilaginibacter sp.]|jgi:gliding motility associated protien GldN|nr:gliding motility protein GldN [Mucilaginibacter sp.]
MKKKILVIVLCLACVAGYAQKRKKKAPAKKPAQTAASNAGTQAAVDTTQKQQVASSKPGKPFDRPLDGYYKKTNILSAKVTPYPNLRESDVAYAKRVWREIDTREKMNQFFSSPKRRLIEVFMDAIQAGELTAYDATPGSKEDINGDEFSKPLTAAQARNKMADSVVVDKFDKNGDKVGSSLKAGEFNPDSIIKFRIKEDWIFDRQRSIFEPRIVGIAPMIRIKVGGVEGDYQPAFWIYFPDARQILATKEVVSRNSDATGLSFDDVFMKRIFTSYIVKVSNDKDERIKDYAQGIDKLYEAERIKKQLMDWELNLWSY